MHPRIHPKYSTPVHQYTSTPVHQYTSTPVHQYTSTPVHQYSSTPVHQYTSTPVHQYTHTHTHARAHPGYRPTHLYIYPVVPSHCTMRRIAFRHIVLRGMGLPWLAMALHIIIYIIVLHQTRSCHAVNCACILFNCTITSVVQWISCRVCRNV